MVVVLIRRPIRQDVRSTDETVTESGQELSWTESNMIVEEMTLYPEILEGGRSSFSARMVLAEEPESSSNTRNRTVIQLAFGLEEKDVQTFSRMLGRKVYLNQQRSVDYLEREQLTSSLEQAQRYIASLEKKVSYLNDSLHHYVQESRELPPAGL